MALPTSGQLTFSQIYAEVYGSHSTQQCSMFAMATEAGKSTSNIGVDDWYEYTNKILSVSPSSIFWAGWNNESGYGETVTVTITPDATFSSTIPTWVYRSYNQTNNTMFYYPTSTNPSTTSARSYTSTISASGYPSDTVILNQAAFELS
jgi:hypothetical protein